MIQTILDFIGANTEAFKVIGSVIAGLIILPVTVIWLRAGKVRKIQQQYTKLVVDMSEQITLLYKEITLIQAELAKTKGQLSIKESEIEVLEQKIKDLEEHIKELMNKLSLNDS